MREPGWEEHMKARFGAGFGKELRNGERTAYRQSMKSGGVSQVSSGC